MSTETADPLCTHHLRGKVELLNEIVNRKCIHAQGYKYMTFCSLSEIPFHCDGCDGRDGEKDSRRGFWDKV